MQKTYDPHSIEQPWYQKWEESGYFAPRGDSERSYCIMIPPPNVTGSLHMGHGFNNAIMDTLIRYHRMKGDKTLWQPGTDHAGIATQMVVERQLEAEGLTRHDLGREKFIERIWQWKEKSGGNITRQLRRLGSSLDWEHERFTMDEGLSEAVKEAFVRLYEEGLIYRGKRLVNWDPKFHTAVSDLEVIPSDEKGSMWHIRYPLSSQQGHLVVATTRPETLLGDCAVAVAPGDERYAHLVGQTVELPLTGRHIPIIVDEHVDPEFGTGCVKITPAHDFNDYEVWQRHNEESPILEQPHGGLINIFTVDAAIRANEADEGQLIPEAYVGLDRFEARKRIVADLEQQGLLEKVEEHALTVPRGDRSGVIIEPFLTDQWYVKTGPLAKPAIDAVESGRIRFIPDNEKNSYFEWMYNIQDWCISRQIWWGHRIPAWYDQEGNVFVGRNEAEVREKHGLGDIELRQDEDVLDTWFSSALWPFSTLGWPEQTERLRDFYPTQVLVTGFDIVFFWVARMIMFGLRFMDDQVPFEEVYVHGLVRDSHGQKMSKSKGNVLDPIDLIDGIDLESLVKKRTSGMMQPQMAKKIEKQTREEFPNGIQSYGADALRFTFTSLASTGRDVKFDMGRIEGYRNFCNKIWNATRFVLQNTEGQDTGLGSEAVEYSLADRWIVSRLQRVEGEVARHLDNYRFDLASRELYEFIWNDYCDWYIELSKPVLYADDASEAAQRATRQTLVRVLEAMLRLLHPIMPFITEELWQRVAPLAGKSGDSIMLQPWPEPDSGRLDPQAEAELDWVKQFIMGVRQIRSEMNIKPGQPLPVLLHNGDEQDRERLQRNEGFLKALARLESITWLETDSEVPESATALVGDMKLLIPLAGLIDKEAELARLEKNIARLRDEVVRVARKLDNPNFVERAPEAVVNKEREKLVEAESALASLEAQAARIRAL